MTQHHTNTIYILGAGAIGLGLAVHLANKGRQIVLVRTSTADVPQSTVIAQVKRPDAAAIQAQVEVISLEKLQRLDGIIVVAAKAYGNESIAQQLKAKQSAAPIIIMQNGIGIEQPYQQAGFTDIYRSVLYSGGQKTDSYEVAFRSVKSSPIGIIEGSKEMLQSCIDQLTTAGFPFHADFEIQTEIWTKGIINAVFNTICPLLEIDNGIFDRDQRVAEMAEEVIRECIQVARVHKIELDERDLMAQLLTISRGSTGQLVSTLQDIQRQQETEIDSLNGEIARLADAASPKVNVTKTNLLGELVQIKASLNIL